VWAAGASVYLLLLVQKVRSLLALLEAGMRACGRSCLGRKDDAACERAQRMLTYADVC
jgi:hypothetical protein